MASFFDTLDRIEKFAESKTSPGGKKTRGGEAKKKAAVQKFGNLLGTGLGAQAVKLTKQVGRLGAGFEELSGQTIAQGIQEGAGVDPDDPDKFGGVGGVGGFLRAPVRQAAGAVLPSARRFVTSPFITATAGRATGRSGAAARAAELGEDFGRFLRSPRGRAAAGRMPTSEAGVQGAAAAARTAQRAAAEGAEAAGQARRFGIPRLGRRGVRSPEGRLRGVRQTVRAGAPAATGLTIGGAAGTAIARGLDLGPPEELPPVEDRARLTREQVEARPQRPQPTAPDSTAGLGILSPDDIDALISGTLGPAAAPADSSQQVEAILEQTRPEFEAARGALGEIVTGAEGRLDARRQEAQASLQRGRGRAAESLQFARGIAGPEVDVGPLAQPAGVGAELAGQQAVEDEFALDEIEGLDEGVLDQQKSLLLTEKELENDLKLVALASDLQTDRQNEALRMQQEFQLRSQLFGAQLSQQQEIFKVQLQQQMQGQVLEDEARGTMAQIMGSFSTQMWNEVDQNGKVVGEFTLPSGEAPPDPPEGSTFQAAGPPQDTRPEDWSSAYEILITAGFTPGQVKLFLAEQPKYSGMMLKELAMVGGVLDDNRPSITVASGETLDMQDYREISGRPANVDAWLERIAGMFGGAEEG